MLTTLEIVERLKTHTDTGSAYAVAKLLGVSRQALTRYESKDKTMSDEVGIRAAKILRIKPEYVLACLAAERAKDSPAALHWAHIAQHLTPKKRRASA